MKPPHRIALYAGALALGIAGLFSNSFTAQIERLDLPSMVAKTDNSVYAEIVAKRVIRVDDPVDGPELFYTILTLEGTSLRNGASLSVDVTFPGGFINDKEGVHNSEAPSADDIKVGNRVVAFYKWSNNMGGQVRGNALYASHGGIYRTTDSPKGRMVLGRGDGYAVAKNLALADLETAVRSLVTEKK
ncbi:MAG: hypothetical protein FJ299_02285 [Planctomycetes bacterium]|nr:hypothetical protein [Planctomycetota bacterium]